MCHNIVGVYISLLQEFLYEKEKWGQYLSNLKIVFSKFSISTGMGKQGAGVISSTPTKKLEKKLPRAALMHLPKTLSSSETDAFFSLTQITRNSYFLHPYQTKLKSLVSDN